jgi:hypothetical protein
MFLNATEKQRYYRLRRRLARLRPTGQLLVRAELVHDVIADAAAQGNKEAQEMLGGYFMETALKVLVRYGSGNLKPEHEVLPFWRICAFDRDVE